MTVSWRLDFVMYMPTTIVYRNAELEHDRRLIFKTDIGVEISISHSTIKLSPLFLQLLVQCGESWGSTKFEFRERMWERGNGRPRDWACAGFLARTGKWLSTIEFRVVMREKYLATSRSDFNKTDMFLLWLKLWKVWWHTSAPYMQDKLCHHAKWLC